MSVSELPPEALAPDPEPLLEVPGPADGPLPPRDRDLRTAWRALSWVVVLACCAVVFFQLNPPLLFRNTTANGGDMGAHVWFPAYLRDHLLPHWRVAGWAPDWFAGFPAGQFYFPVPALLTVVLDVFLPYNIAFKLVTALGPVLLPFSAYGLGRGLQIRRPGPELFAVAATVFLFFKGVSGAAAGSHAETIQFNQRIMGGPLVSSLAGEYSFTLALALGLAFLGALAYSLRTRRRLWLPAALLFATVLCHIVVAIFVVVGALVVWLFYRPTRTFRMAAAIGVVGGLLTAFWTVPLLATFGYTANMRYEKLTWYLDYLFPKELWWVIGLALIGVVIGAFRRSRGVFTLLTLTVVFAVVFRVWPELHAWNLRFLPFWYIGLYLLAAVGVAEMVRGISHQAGLVWLGPQPAPGDDWGFDAGDARRFRLVKSSFAIVLVVLLTVGGLFYAHSKRGDLDFWAEWNYSGYQDTNPSSTKPKPYGEYRDLMQTMGRLPAGRAMWEGGQAIDTYGTSLALMLLPYWTNGRIASMEGLYYESAATTPFHFMAVAPLSGPGNASNPVRGLDYRTITDFDLGVRYMKLLGVRYYMAYSTEAKQHADANPDLRLVATVPDRDKAAPLGWKIYEVRGEATVAPLQYEPVVVTPHAGTQSECFRREPAADQHDPELGPWECLAAGWWNDPAALDRPLAAGGPQSWARVPASRAKTAPRKRLPAVKVSDVRETDDSVSFRVSRTGVPVVVRTSYYPNWEATGAEGPWRLTPNFMVVTPTSRNVTLHYARSGPEKVGIALSILGLVGLAGLVVWKPADPGPFEPRRRRGRRGSWGRRGRRGQRGRWDDSEPFVPDEYRTPDPAPEAGPEPVADIPSDGADRDPGGELPTGS